MSRPAFQFYPADWRKNAKLRRCSPAARGVWVDILCLLHDSDEYGILRWPLKDIIQASGASKTHVRELVEKGVLKGADRDAEAYVYRPKHAGKEGEPVVLAFADGGPMWYCSRFVRDEYVRQRRGESTRFDGTNQPSSRSPKGGIGGRQGDGPSSSSSSSSLSVSNETGPAGADRSVDKSISESDDRAEAKRILRQDTKDWLTSNGISQADAQVCLNTIAKDHRAVTEAAFREAIRIAQPPKEARAYLWAIVHRLEAEATAQAAPVAKAEKAVEATQAHLAEQAAHVPKPPPPAAAEALQALRKRLDKTSNHQAANEPSVTEGEAA